MNTGWWEIDFHGCYPQVKIVFAPVCACKNSRRIWRHNASTPPPRDVTEQLWWRHNAGSEETVLGDNGEISDRWLFVTELCVENMCVRNTIIHSLPWITIFLSLVRRFGNDFHSRLGHSWKSLQNRLTRDKKSLWIHGNSYTTGKKYGIFFITAILCIFVECEGCFCTWNTFLRADITFGGVNFHLTAKWSGKVQKQLFRYFSQLDFG